MKTNTFNNSAPQEYLYHYSRSIVLLLFLFLSGFYSFSQTNEPYQPLKNGTFKAKPTAFSPDPII
jgi:hypothetical protein